MAKAPIEGARRAGASTEFDQFFAAIAGQESGGNYGAVNGRTGASGKYQIMPANIGPWSQQVLGYRVSVDEFRRSPDLQEKIARGVMEGYFNKYGARGAASTWYSGSPGGASSYKRFNANEPSIGEYVDQVMARVGKPGGRAGNAGSANAAEAPRGIVETASRAPAPTYTGSPITAPQIKDPSFLDAPQKMDLVSRPKQSTGDPFGNRTGDPFPAFSAGGDPMSQPAAAPASVAAAAQTAATGGPRVGETGSEFRDRVITNAMKMIGTPYVWGGTSSKGVDCSGLIQRVLGEMGYKVPRVSQDQAKFGKKTDLASLRPGDLVTNTNNDHIAFYGGDGYIIEAAHAGTDVRRRKLGASENYYGVQLNLPGDTQGA